MSLPSVVFPEPLSPIMPSVVPFGIESDMSFNVAISLFLLPYVFVTCFTVIKSVVMRHSPSLLLSLYYAPEHVASNVNYAPWNMLFSLGNDEYILLSLLDNDLQKDNQSYLTSQWKVSSLLLHVILFRIIHIRNCL